MISFQAATLDWQATADFESELSGNLANIADESDGDFTVQLSGRSLILAQVTADVADSAVISTGTVAAVILLMLVGINTVRQKDVIRGAARVRNLDSTDGRCGLGVWNHGPYRISIEFTNCHDWCTHTRIRC